MYSHNHIFTYKNTIETQRAILVIMALDSISGLEKRWNLNWLRILIDYDVLSTVKFRNQFEYWFYKLPPELVERWLGCLSSNHTIVGSKIDRRASSCHISSVSLAEAQVG